MDKHSTNWLLPLKYKEIETQTGEGVQGQFKKVSEYMKQLINALIQKWILVANSLNLMIDAIVALQGTSHTQGTDTTLGAQAENLDMNTHKVVGVVDPTTDQEAATKKYVDDNIPGGEDADSIIKGWIHFNGTGAIAIKDSYNVSGIVDNGVGQYSVTWDTDFANAFYCGQVTVGLLSENALSGGITAIATTALQVFAINQGVGFFDPTIVCVTAIGDQ